MNAEDNNSHLYAIIEEQKRGLLGFLQRVDWLEEEIERLREAMEEYVNTVVKMEGVTFVEYMENAELRAVVESILAEKEKR